MSFCFASFFPVKTAVRTGAGRKGSIALRGVAAGSAAGIIGALVFGLTDYIWSYPRIMLLYWLLFGVMLAAVRLCGSETDKA